MTQADEAHRLHQYKNISYNGPFKDACKRIGLTTEADELDWIMHQCDCPILFYDKMQVVGPSGINMERFSDKMENDRKKRLVKYFKLSTQMRVKGGNDYIGYIENILQCKEEKKRTFSNYELGLFRDFSAFEHAMYKKEAEAGLTRMIAGYSWEWVSKKDPTKYDIEIAGVKRKWNHCTEGWVLSKEAIDEVGCIHSVQGYDLNYAFVIFGREIFYNKDTNEIGVKRELYFDDNGKKTATDEELLEVFQWSGSDTVCEAKKDKIREELADVLNYCILMADACGLDMDEIVQEKIERNNEKYPVDKAKDSAKKYNEL